MIECHDMSFEVNRRLILNDISFRIKSGRRCALIGQNGSGKSTLLKILSGLLKPKQGKATFNAHELLKSPTRKSALWRGYLPQLSPQHINLRVKDIIELGLWPHQNKARHHMSSQPLIEFGLTDLKERQYNTLSGGERQRVHLARIAAQLSIADEPPLILLDEPDAHLDIKATEDVFQILHSDVFHADVTMLVALHHLNLVKPYFDDVIMLKDGRVFSYGTVSDVFTQQAIEDVFEVDTQSMAHLF